MRGAHGAQALSWSGELADAAQRWADNCVFEHSGGSLGPFGENLAAGTGAYGPADAVAGWASEGEKFDRSNPEAGGAGHFTQMVWKGTTQLGCAAADCEGIIGSGVSCLLLLSNGLTDAVSVLQKARYHVCEYSEPGNVQEQFAYVASTASFSREIGIDVAFDEIGKTSRHEARLRCDKLLVVRYRRALSIFVR